MRKKLVIARHHALLKELGLASIDAVKTFEGELVKDHRGQRDILRIDARNSDETPLRLYLKRTWKPHTKDGLATLVRYGAVRSVSREEWENLNALAGAGLKTAEPVAYGEECGLFRERFSFILTEAASGRSLEEFVTGCRNSSVRRRIFDALARELSRMHDSGLATPDLFTRHIFIDETGGPTFSLIDMARMNRARKISKRLRVRDLAALNATSPLRFVTARERIRFLKVYAGAVDRRFVTAIERRMAHLLKREKFQDFLKRSDA